MSESVYRAVHGAMYLSRAWHPTKQPPNQRDRWIDAGEAISLWQADGPDHWFHWHIDNPHVIRIKFEGAVLADLEWLVAPYAVARSDDTFDSVTVAKRLWRFDPTALPDIKAVDTAKDILSFDAFWREGNMKRAADGGVLLNKAAEDAPLHDADRISSVGGWL